MTRPLFTLLAVLVSAFFPACSLRAEVIPPPDASARVLYGVERLRATLPAGKFLARDIDAAKREDRT